LKIRKTAGKTGFESKKREKKSTVSKKQDAEEQLNRLKDKLRNSGTQEKQTEEKQSHQKFESISFGKTNSLLRKLDSIESGEKIL